MGGLDRRHVPYWSTLVERAQQLEPGAVWFAGARRDVAPLLAQFRVFVMYSKPQGCPNASLEAMAAALPVVANDEGGAAEQIEHGVTGYLCRGDDPGEMAAHVAELLERPARARAFGRAGQRLARRRFSMEQMVDHYLRLFEGRPPRRPRPEISLQSTFVAPRATSDGGGDGDDAPPSDAGHDSDYGAPGETAAAASQTAPSGKPLTIALVDADDQPVPHARYVVKRDDEEIRSGELDDNGCASVEGLKPGDYDVEFPDYDDLED